MNAAAAVTPSSPQKTSITTRCDASAVKLTLNGKNMNMTDQSKQFIGDGEQSASVCVGCNRHLLPQETYACDRCAAGWMQDANFNMCGGEDNG